MTTLYNHNTLGTANKPLISNAEFKAMTESVKAGNSDVSAWVDKYSLEHFQKQFIEAIINDLNKAKKRAQGYFQSLVDLKVSKGTMKHTAQYGACQWLTKELALQAQLNEDLDGLTLEQYQKVAALCNKYL
jgi:hypothetical protein